MTSSQPQLPQAKLWNKLPPEIVGIILSNLGKHDLLNARLISHTWNDESLKVLRKSNFTQLLREGKIKEFLLFATRSEPCQFIIPFHLNFKTVSVPSADLSLKTVIPYVNSLCQIFGPQCVSTLSLTNKDTVSTSTEEATKETDLIEFLGLISPGLKSLDLRRFNSRINFLKSQNPNHILSLPKLKSLICNTSQKLPREIGQDLAYISIIENSPNLEDLTLTHPCDLESWPLNFNKLKSLSMDAMINPQKILDKILASSGPPVLRELSLLDDMRATSENKFVVNNILHSVSTTLKSLKLREHMPFYVRNAGNSRIMTFPKLPHLEHLGLQYNVGRKCVLNSEDINLNEETFPSLKSIELPIGMIFTSSPDQSEEDDNMKIEFPKLTQLILRVNDSDGQKYLDGTLEHLQKTFPTVSKLSLVNVGGDDCVKHILDRILKSEWSTNIQEFGMIGFNEDFLGEVLSRLDFSPRVVLEKCDGILIETLRNEFQTAMKRMGMECEATFVNPASIILARTNPMASVKMTNVTAIKLELIDEPSHEDDDRDTYLSSTASIPNLIGLAKYFPQLRMIEISKLLFLETDKSVLRRHIRVFKSKFPGVVLNLA